VIIFLQVAQRAGEIAKELGLMTKADQVDSSQTNATGGTWMNLNFLNRNGSDTSNSSWYNSDSSLDPEDRRAAAALQKYQQLDSVDIDDAEVAEGPRSDSSLGQAAVTSHNRLHSQKHSHDSNLTELESTRSQSRAERAGSRQQPLVV